MQEQFSKAHALTGVSQGPTVATVYATVTVYDSLGTDKVQEVDVDSLKWRFFELGVRVGIALQMLFICVLLMIPPKNEAISELSGLYYPLFRGVFLLSFFGVLFALMLFAWKRKGIDYCAILNVLPHRTNYHAVVRAASTLMSLNFVAFVGYWLTVTVHLTASKDLWPLVALAGTVLLLCAPFNWMPEWQDAAQRAALLRIVGSALAAPFAAPSFAASFVADVFTSMPKCFVDLLFATCIYTSGEAFSIGSWDRNAQTFQRPLVICTASDPIYHVANVALLMLPFCIRLLQCVRQIYDARREGSEGWRQPLANSFKYTTSLVVQAISISGGSVQKSSMWNAWLAISIFSTFFAFSWDVLIDWGLGPQPLRRAVRSVLTPSAPSGGEYEGASYWLRPVRVFKVYWYAIGIATDLLFRLGWAVYISPGQQLVANHMTLVLGSIELMRRANWALFRLEWEQILRVAKHEHDLDVQLASDRGIDTSELTMHRSTSSLMLPLLSDMHAVEPAVRTPSKDERIASVLNRNMKRMNRHSWETLPGIDRSNSSQDTENSQEK